VITRRVLHRLVDKLPETALLTAARVLTALNRPPDALEILLDNAPVDDQPDDDDFDGGLTEALAETEFVSHNDVMRRLFHEP
jgi:hypothetical protein